MCNSGKFYMQVKTAKMRKCLTKFSFIFKFGAATLLCCGLMASSPWPCASSRGRLPEALFLIFRLESQDAKVHRCGLIVSSMVHFFTRMTLRCSASRGVQTGFKGATVHKSCRSKMFQNEYLIAKSASIQPRTSPSKLDS